MDLKKELSYYAGLTEAEISRYMEGLDELYGPLRDLFSRGGKRLRPALCMISCEAVGGRGKDALKVAAAIEMVHNFTLIHDDIADRSELRRGKPCLHRTYGTGLAVNSGDGLFAVAYEALSDAMARMDEKTAKRVFKVFSSRVTQICEGQAMDIAWVQDKRWDLMEKDYFEMLRRKTGALMSASCEIGGLIGGGSNKQVNALRDFGMDIGVGFQIHDDVLNLKGDVKKYGKEIGGDINEGKRTLIVIHTLEACVQGERDFLVKALDKERNSQNEIRSAIEIINKYHSVEKAAEVARKIVNDGKKGLKALPDSEAKEKLLAIADYLVEREA